MDFRQVGCGTISLNHFGLSATKLQLKIYNNFYVDTVSTTLLIVSEVIVLSAVYVGKLLYINCKFIYFMSAVNIDYKLFVVFDGIC